MDKAKKKRANCIIRDIATKETKPLIVGNIPEEWSIEKAKSSIEKRLLTSQFNTLMFKIENIHFTQKA